MRIKDYIFYRMYLAYRKHEEFGRITTMLYFTWIEYFLTFPISFIFLSIIKPDSKATSLITAAIPMVIIFLLNLKRYHSNKKIDELKSRFKNSKYNYRIKNWMLYLLPLVASFIGIFELFILTKLVDKG